MSFFRAFLMVAFLASLGCARTAAPKPATPKPVAPAMCERPTYTAHDFTPIPLSDGMRCIIWIPSDGDSRTIITITRSGEEVSTMSISLSDEMFKKFIHLISSAKQLYPDFAQRKVWTLCSSAEEAI